MTLRADSITLGYLRARPVLHRFSLSLRPGRVTAIVGPNGAGKTTLARALLGLIAPWEGACFIGDEDIRRLPARRRAALLSYIPQRPSVAGGFSAREIVRMGQHALPRDERIVESALAGAGAAELSAAAFNSLSVGQQQRVTLARALAQLGWRNDHSLEGQTLIADEPVSAMDPRHALATLRTLRAVAAAGAAVALVLHDLTSALRFADDAALLDSAGALARFGAAPDVLTPAALEAVFGLPFELAHAPSGPAIEPAAR